MKSVMSAQQHFSQVPSVKIERSSFDRSHGHKSTFNEGELVPFYVDEALPGDSFNLRATMFARIATLLKPPMDNMWLESFFFSVPYRLVWQNWEKFNGEQTDPGDSTDFEIPYVLSPATTGWQTGSLADYMGIPVGVPGLKHSSLPFRAAALCYNHWFRDQNLQQTITVPLGDGPDSDTSAIFQLRRINKAHDYFTSGLPWPQKTNQEVTLPVGATAPVISDYSEVHLVAAGDTTNNRNFVFVDSTGTGGTQPFLGADGGNLASGTAVQFGDVTGLQADLSQATATTVNALRQAFQLQRLFERDARGGTRYPEVLKAHFGVRDPQFDVLQRPQYLGGGKTAVVAHTVPQASPTGTYADTPQGNLAAYGTIQATGHGFTKSFTEHCIIIGFVAVRSDQNYQYGLERMWSRQTRFDHYWPALAHLGEQSILNKELFAQGTAADDEVFAYQERFAEYRYKPSRISGLFRSNETNGTPLDFWHLAQEYANLPTLSSEFIEENAPVDRIIAVPSEPHFIFDSFIKLTCARPMPIFSVPGYIDHF